MFFLLHHTKKIVHKSLYYFYNISKLKNIIKIKIPYIDGVMFKVIKIIIMRVVCIFVFLEGMAIGVISAPYASASSEAEGVLNSNKSGETVEKVLIPGQEGFKAKGKRGRLTMEQSKAIALQKIPGEVVKESVFITQGHPYHEFHILDKNGSIYEIEINADLAKIYKIWVIKYKEKSPLPFVLKEEKEIIYAVKQYIQNQTKGKSKPKIENISFKIQDRRFVYSVNVKKLVRRYRVVLDAQTAEVISFKQR